MDGRIAFSLLLALTIVSAPVPVSARTCILSNTVSEKACKPACCANMSCCEMSQNNTAPATPPLAKAPANDNSTVALAPSYTSIFVLAHFQSAKVNNPSTGFIAHSPPLLALNCALLI
jgi:hypothetical protein